MLDTPPRDGRLPALSSSSSQSPNSQYLVNTASSPQTLSEQVDSVGDETLLATSLLDSSPGRSPAVSMSTPPGRPQQQHSFILHTLLCGYIAHSTDSETLVKVSDALLTLALQEA